MENKSKRITLKIGKQYEVTFPDGTKDNLWLQSKEVCSCGICGKGKDRFGTDGVSRNGLYFTNTEDSMKMNYSLEVGSSCKNKCTYKEL